MHKLLLFLVIALFSPLSLAGTPSFPGGPGQYAVGLRVVQLSDSSRTYRGKIDPVSGAAVQGDRTRPIQALVWYPAENQGGPRLRYLDYVRSAATEERFDRDEAAVSQFAAAYLQENYPILDPAQREAALAQPMLARREPRPAPGKFPLVIYAPGSSMSAHENADLCEYLASHGYVVIASASMGIHARSIDLDLESAESQARDMSFLLGYAETLPQVDRRHVAAMGYSFGGLANVLAAARDDRIGALVSLDGSVRYFPSIVKAAAYATPERLALPMLYLGAKPSAVEALSRAKDVPTSYSLMNRMKYADLYKLTMDTMEHAAFQSEALRLGPEARFGDYSRAEAVLAHGWMGRYVRAFLDAYLRGDASSLAFMRARPAANGVPPHVLAVDVQRADGEPATLATLASAYARRGHKDLAAIYRDMTRREPAFKPDERALISWGERFLDLKRYAEATEIYQFTTNLYPDSGRAVFYLAMTHDRNQNKPAALEAYRRVLGFWPDQAEAMEAIRRLER